MRQTTCPFFAVCGKEDRGLGPSRLRLKSPQNASVGQKKPLVEYDQRPFLFSGLFSAFRKTFWPPPDCGAR